jgi:hypothetical protein
VGERDGIVVSAPGLRRAFGLSYQNMILQFVSEHTGVRSDEDAPSRERDDDWRYLADVTPDDVLGVFDSVDGPTITTSDVVAVLGCSGEVARTRLNDLVECGLVERRKSGRVVLWWRLESDQAVENPYLRGFGALADTAIPEQMKQERERARHEWASSDDSLSG